MNTTPRPRRTTLVDVVFDLLNPMPFGFFVAALIFDGAYAENADVLWFKSAAWLIAAGLVLAVIPRLINLFKVWFPRRRLSAGGDRAAFVFYLLGIVAAIVNAFVHSRDAYAIVPEGLWLSIATVAFLVISTVLVSLQRAPATERLA